MAGGDRIASIQLARAIAAIAVAVAHVWAEFGPLGLVSPLPTFTEGAAGVDLFFVVSGFVIVLSSEKLAGKPGGVAIFAVRRVARIVPLYWAVTAATLWVIFQSHLNLAMQDLSWRSVLASYVFLPYPRPSGQIIPVIAQGWTLYFETFFYIIFALALTFNRLGSIVAASAALVAVDVAFHLSIALPEPLRFWANPIVLEFVFGMAICLAYQRGFRVPAWCAALILAVALALLFRPGSVNGGWVTLGGREYEWGGAAALAVGALALGKWPKGPAFAVAPILLLGDASYALYLVHGLVYWKVRDNFASAIGVAAHPYFFSFVLFASAICVSIAAHLLFERPITRLLRNAIAGLWRESMPPRGAAARSI